ncbi:MAG: polymer-forming cytoskeletal protein [Betaproteobacteria bacterium]|jgi:cytoskeletal protein CcmA (bactofilin family)
MFGNESKKPQSRIDTLIGVGTAIEGNITFSGGLRVDGQVRGNVSCSVEQPGMLVISEQALVEGEIRVDHVMINGRVKGPVFAAQSIELQSKANVEGDLHYQKLEMQMGAVIQGQLIYVPHNHSDKVVQLKTNTAE